jgi:3-isopropylmalate dehydrogenase
MLLAWLGERRGDAKFVRAAEFIDQALDRTLASPDGHTRDLGGALSTDAFAKRVVVALRESSAS